MAGADGWEFVEAYTDVFGVDIAQFQPDPHFGPEAASLLVPSVLFLMGVVVVTGVAVPWTIPLSIAALVVGYRRLGRRSEQSGPYTLTVADLVGYAEAGVWAFDYERARYSHRPRSH